MEVVWEAPRTQSVVSPEVLAACGRELLCLSMEVLQPPSSAYISVQPSSFDMASSTQLAAA